MKSKDSIEKPHQEQVINYVSVIINANIVKILYLKK